MVSQFRGVPECEARVNLRIKTITKPIKCQCCPHIETNQLIYRVNQLTDFYIWATLAFNGLNVWQIPVKNNCEC